MAPTSDKAEWTPRQVPWAVQAPDRIPKQRYYDPEFYALENELFWPRVWQMACRLEEVPKPGDFVEYEILDQSIIVVRVDDDDVRAYYNSCRHRGMKLVEGSGSRRTFVCPFHGWCWGIDGKNTFVLRPNVFDDASLDADDLALTSVRCETWGGCAWINLDEAAPPLRGVHRALRRQARRMEHRRAAHRVVEVVRAAGQLEVGHGGLHGGLPRTADPPATPAVVAQSGTSPAWTPSFRPACTSCGLSARGWVG